MIEVVGLFLAVASVVIAFIAYVKPRAPATASVVEKEVRAVHSSETVMLAYLGFIRDQLKYLDFRGVIRLDRIDLKFALEDVTVEPRLRALRELSSADAVAGGWEVAIEDLALALEQRMIHREEIEAPASLNSLSLPGAVAVILGDPGSGKTTALKLIALRMCSASQGMGAATARMPILLPLTAYSEAIRSRVGESAISLEAFVVGYLKQTKNMPNEVGEMFREALTKGACVFLFDGLDEVIDSAERSYLLERVKDFIAWQRKRGNTFVVTSRLVGYADSPLVGNEIAHFVLCDFADDEVSKFIRQWTLVAERMAGHANEQTARDIAEREANAIQRAVVAHPGVRRLSSNPLLLTVLVFIHRQGMELPSKRAELYELYLRTLINSWSRARNLDGRAIQPLDESEVTKILAPVAYWLHSNFPAGHCRKADFIERVANVYEGWRGVGKDIAEARAAELVDALLKFAGLLSERGEDRVSFAHLTFEEYLSARHIALEGQVDKQRCVKLLAPHVDSSQWVEVTCLVLGYFGSVAKEEHSASLLVEGLAKCEKNGDLTAGFLWAAEALADAGCDSVTHKTATEFRFRAQEIATTATVRSTRWRAGRVLAKLGDPRFCDKEGAPEMRLIEGGRFLMGSPDVQVMRRHVEIDKVELSEENSWVREYWSTIVESERPQCEVYVQEFKLARFPVTCSQYAKFLEECPERGVPTEHSARSEAYSWDPLLRSAKAGRENQPVVLVSWHDANAYVEWLSEVTNRRFRLPTECEWEFSARGTDGRIFPWGSKWDASKTNTIESGANDVVAVGLYPEGASPAGIEDASGHVWEWTQTSWGPDWRTPVRSETSESRIFPWKVVRGGSWDDVGAFANAATRGPNLATFRSHYIGFRIAEDVSPSRSPAESE
jgi:formylglycine-generating enzyme required for sulfatase activity